LISSSLIETTDNNKELICHLKQAHWNQVRKQKKNIYSCE